MNPRVRFAPSPTGFLHIGGARTALFNYLFAKRHQGVFLLRIEDTDQERSTKEATDAILDGLQWLGLQWDEGPFFQSQRSKLYKPYIEKLLDQRKAYRCYCTKEELETRRKEQLARGKPPQYDRRCRKKINEVLDKPHVVRFLVPEGCTQVTDLVKGDISFENQEIEDFVLARSNGSPTYNFVVVIDDVDMKITHVIRGDDHLNNTAKQILLYQALGVEIPKFAHLPLILGKDRQRLSKRHGATSVQAYRDMGYLPHALVNFLARLGWSHGDQEVFSIQELIEKFDFDHVGKAAGVFNAEKLLWLNQHYIKTEDAQILLSEISRFLEIPEARKKGEGWKHTVDSLRERSKTIKEMAELSRFYFLDKISYDERAAQKFLVPELASAFEKLKTMFQSCEPFNAETIKPLFEDLLKELGMKMKALAQPLRVALTGGTVSPGIYEVIELVGKERAVARLNSALKRIESSSN